MEGIELKPGITEFGLESGIYLIFKWYMENGCRYIRRNYDKDKKRVHLYTKMRPIILAKIFNITTYPKVDDWSLIFQPPRIDHIFIDDRIDHVWVDDIMPIRDIANLFKRWYINAMIAEYLDQSILDEVTKYDNVEGQLPLTLNEFFKMLKKEIDAQYIMTMDVIDHNNTSTRVSSSISKLFKIADEEMKIVWGEDDD